MSACVHVVHGCRLQLRPGGGVPELAGVRPPALFSPIRCIGGFLSKSKYPSLSRLLSITFLGGTTSEKERLNESFVCEKIVFANFCGNFFLFGVLGNFAGLYNCFQIT